MLSAPQNCVTDAALAARLAALRQRVAAAAHASGRTEDSITLVAVSKGHPVAAIEAAVAAGCREFGESYLQEAQPKIAALRPAALVWHHIGRLQANKTRSIAEQFDWVHGIERLQIASRLSAQRPFHAAPLNVCLQVNLLGEARKGGVPPAELAALAAGTALLPRLRLRGLMCVLPDGLAAAVQRAAFARLSELQAGLHRTLPGLDTLSMGMSADFEAAIAAGATVLRIGTAIFGPRAG
jgi:pyridoxal phosphate enzyme (YggS family)